MWYKTWKPWSCDYVFGSLNHRLFWQDNQTLKPLIIWWYKIWNPPFIGKNCFGSFAIVSHGYVLNLGFAKMPSSSSLHKECQYICEEMLGFFVCDTHKITIAYLVILVFWFCWNWHTMVYLQSVFYCGELEDQTVLAEHAQHSEGSIFHPLPHYAGFSVRLAWVLAFWRTS